MKNFKDTLFLLMCFAFVIACQNPTTAPDTGNTDDTAIEENVDTEQQVMVEDTISRDTFNTWRSRWASLHTPYMDSTTIDFFDVPLIDLEEVLNEGAITSYFYMGLQQLGSGQYTPHLMIVGVTQSGPDYSLILDYTATCPPYCP